MNALLDVLAHELHLRSFGVGGCHQDLRSAEEAGFQSAKAPTVLCCRAGSLKNRDDPKARSLLRVVRPMRLSRLRGMLRMHSNVEIGSGLKTMLGEESRHPRG